VLCALSFIDTHHSLGLSLVQTYSTLTLHSVYDCMPCILSCDFHTVLLMILWCVSSVKGRLQQGAVNALRLRKLSCY